MVNNFLLDMKKPYSFLILTSLTFPLIVGSAKAEIVIQSGTTMQPTFNGNLPTGVNNVSGTTAPTNIIFTQDRNCKTDGELSNYQSILLQACINEIVDEAKGGSPYFQGLLGIYLRAGEAGSIVNIDVSKQWSNVSYQKNHPFGSYNLANLAMLDGNFAKATQYYQDAALLLQRQASSGDAVGDYSINWNAANHSSGIYILSMKAGNHKSSINQFHKIHRVHLSIYLYIHIYL